MYERQKLEGGMEKKEKTNKHQEEGNGRRSEAKERKKR